MSHTVEVAAALVQDEAGRYLITRRRRGTHLEGLWEFPGGKREGGETLEACLRRELAEELGAECVVGEKVDTVTWRYPEKIVVLHFYRCRVVAGVVASREDQEMAWAPPSRLGDYRFPPADEAIVARLRQGAG